MRILYDGNIYGIQSAGGINRYFANLISRLPSHVTPVLTTCRRQHLNYPTHKNLDLRFFPRPEIRGFRRASYWIGQQYFRSLTQRQTFDLQHPTYYSLLNHQPIDAYPFPMVLTVHDFIHDRFDPHHQDVQHKHQAILRAQSILCVSENTKQDLLDYYPFLEDKITVTPLASEINGSLADDTAPVPPQPYYLYVGSRTSYKNFDGLLTAFGQVASTDLRLCVVGAEFNAQEQSKITAMGLTDRIHNFGQVSDRHLAQLYRCSLALVYPSFYEGFGIPPLEAMACGTAVIAANTSSLPEVVGDAGILFNPESSWDLAEAMLRLQDSSLERDRLIDKGAQRVKQFSWDKTAAQTYAVYQRMSEKYEKYESPKVAPRTAH
jgi:glycosyltransferase involved in cell wall biosynthesis